MAAAGKKVLMVIAPKNFRDEELVETRQALEAAGAKIILACSTLSDVKGMFGVRARPDILLGVAKAADYDAVVFVGGSGSTVYFDDPKAHALAKATAGAGKLLCAICIAPSILAKAGLLKGKKATVWDDKGPAGPFSEHLKNGGALLSQDDVVRDGKIITANGPPAATKFGRTIVEALG